MSEESLRQSVYMSDNVYAKNAIFNSFNTGQCGGVNLAQQDEFIHVAKVLTCDGRQYNVSLSAPDFIKIFLSNNTEVEEWRILAATVERMARDGEDFNISQLYKELKCAGVKVHDDLIQANIWVRKYFQKIKELLKIYNCIEYEKKRGV